MAEWSLSAGKTTLEQPEAELRTSQPLSNVENSGIYSLLFPFLSHSVDNIQRLYSGGGGGVGVFIIKWSHNVGSNIDPQITCRRHVRDVSPPFWRDV